MLALTLPPLPPVDAAIVAPPPDGVLSVEHRFLYDMFINLDADVSHRLEASTTASFLEIYGEDVYDLLSDGHAPGTKRVSLQARENAMEIFMRSLLFFLCVVLGL